MTMKYEESLLTTKEAARYMNISVSKLYGLRYRSTGPKAIWIGRTLRFRRTDIDVFLEENEERTTTDGK